MFPNIQTTRYIGMDEKKGTYGLGVGQKSRRSKFVI